MQQHKNIILTAKHGKPILADIYHKINNTPKPVVIFCHGFKGFKDWGHWEVVAEAFAEAGFVFVKFNFSHNGTTVDAPLDFGDLEAFGNNNFSIELDDLGVVIDWITNGNSPVPGQELDVSSLYLIGHSRGGGTTILKAAEDERVRKIVTWASVSDFGKRWVSGMLDEWKKAGVIHILNGRTKQQMPLYWQLAENYLANTERLDIPAAAKKLTIPFLIVHGTADPAVSYSEAEELKAWNEGAKLCAVDNGNHVFGGKHPWESDELPADMVKVVRASVDFLRG